MKPLQGHSDIILKPGERSLQSRGTADQHIVVTAPRPAWQDEPRRLSEAPLDAVADHCRAELLRDREPYPCRAVVIALARLDHHARSRTNAPLRRGKEVCPLLQPVDARGADAPRDHQAESRLRPFARRRAITRPPTV